MKKYIYLALVALVGTSIVSIIVAPPPVGTNAASPQHPKKDHAKGNATTHAASESQEGDAAQKKANNTLPAVSN